MRYLKYFILFMITCIVSGCVYPLDLLKREPEKPEKYVNSYTDIYYKARKGLKMFADAEGVEFIEISIDDIPNATSSGKVIYNLRGMLETALTNFGPVVKAIPFAHRYHAKAQEQMYAVAKRIPALLITGEISQYDQEVTVDKNMSVDLALGGGDSTTDSLFDRDKSFEKARIALDLRVVNYADGTYFNDHSVINKILFYNQRTSNKIGFYILGSGFTMRGSVSSSAGKDEALRILANYSLLQVVSAIYQFPWWNCMLQEKPDKILVNEAVKSYMSSSDTEKIKKMQLLMYFYGYEDILINGVMDSYTNDALKILTKGLHINDNPFEAESFRQIYTYTPVCGYIAKQAEYAIEQIEVHKETIAFENLIPDYEKKRQHNKKMNSLFVNALGG